MAEIKKNYVFNENNEKIGVILDVETFEKMERFIEDKTLGLLMEKESGEENLDLNSAKDFYASLEKAG